MISLHNILSIAKYERKTLLRSWFFRIFSILSLFVLFGMNFGMVIEGGGSEGWAIRSIPSAIPYFNLLILNVTQAIIAVFLASDFLKRDKKLDTTEVIYMRSMTNGEYVIGKTWGNLQVFMILNVLVVILALIFNLVAKGTAVAWESYAIYLLAISIPTLIFIMGLAFLLMSIIRNQAITFVLILGYIGITLFLLQAKYYYIFDYMAFNIPMLNSDIIGFGNLETIIIHRGIYLSLGLGFIFGTIFLLKRLPQSELATYFSLVLSIILISTGGYLAYTHINNFKQTENFRSEVIELNNKYVSVKTPSTISQKISLEHHPQSVSVTSELTLKNESNEPINKLVFSLNDGMEIAQLKINGKESPFLREKHLVIVSDNIELNPDEEVKAEFSYKGKINEALCYLDIDKEVLQQKYGKFVINVDKRYAFITPEYLLLTPEANWYPRTGVTYSTKSVSWYQPQFINFNLEVKTKEGLTAISQGEINEVSAGHFKFENNHALTQITLAIGKYEQKSVQTENTEFGVWYLEGHDYFTGSFKEVQDTLVEVITERFEDFKRTYKLDYVSDKLFIVEVPAQFKTYPRSFKSAQEYVQPEQVLIPEKGFMLRSADFENQKKNMKRWSRDDNMTDLDLELRVLGDFARTFTRETETEWRGGPGGGNRITVINPYFIFPMLYNFQNNIQSDQWPITNRIFEAYLKNQATDLRSVFMSRMDGQSPDERANIVLQDSTFQEILADPKQKGIIENVIKLKGDVLFSMIEWKAGQDEFQEFLRKLLVEYTHKNISFEVFSQKIYDEFNLELIPIMDEWFKAKSLPGYLFSAVEAKKVKSGNRMKTMVSLKATNFSDTEGLVKVTFRIGGGPGGRGRGPGGGEEMINKLVYLEPHQTKDLSYLLDADPRMVIINTMTSKNIPQTLMNFFRDIEEDTKAIPVEKEEISDVPVQMALPNEIIVDNEDPEFSVTKIENISLLEKWILQEKKSESKYSGMNWWRPPSNWTLITNTDFYGEYVRSAYYLKGGAGDLKAIWNVPLKDPGYYDVYFHVYKSRSRRRGGGDQDNNGEYNFTIHGDEGAEESTLSGKNAETGWNLLGTYYFTSDTAMIELSNKSDAKKLLFADAVKLVKQ
ncbi:hypothetical protein [uncultured Draconibacterium sp.]|uniref:golvesin C-terminal-like domain-containing protein n=1 Tax=uncultured Draconibacterium sp. TaxID=1573823 RepID=UPI0025E5CF33|nr:hypothetical protein [uncultured Draconibacterium sp.]